MRLVALLLVLWLVAAPFASAQPARSQPIERARLGFLVGEFQGEVQLFPGEGAPTITAPMHYRGAWELDSAWVVARYEQSPGGRTLRGMLLYTWEAKPGRYLFYGVANAPMEPTRMTGTMQGTRLVFEAGSGSSPTYREIWEPAGTDTLITSLEYQRDGRWVTGTRAVLIRANGTTGR